MGWLNVLSRLPCGFTTCLNDERITSDKGFTKGVSTNVYQMRRGGAGPGRCHHVQAGDVVETDFEGFLKLLRSKTALSLSINDHEYYPQLHPMAIGVFRIARPSTTRATLLTAPELVNTVCEVN